MYLYDKKEMEGEKRRCLVEFYLGTNWTVTHNESILGRLGTLESFMQIVTE